MNGEERKKLIASMTLEEKAGLCSGADFWHTKAVERLGIPSAMVSDGPHGLRKQDLEADHLGINESIKAVCFPAGCATAASFDRELLTQIGETLGEECQAEGVSVILGPAVNIKRSPLCGRNFEYYSEDPLLATEMAGALIKGVQSKNVGTSIKHFLANNQETRRLTASSEIDERTLREIYLAAFEGAVCAQKPWTVMCSYNKINGTYAAENKTFLTDILRDEWGFDGFVVSDWGAVNDRPADLKAGLDLEMPSSGGINDQSIVDAVKNHELDESCLDQAVDRILRVLSRFEENRDKTAVFDRDRDHEKARKAAEESIVLLKNDGILPLKEGAKTAFIGKYAEKPRYQGGGSSHINSHKVTSALECAEGNGNIIYAQGFRDDLDRRDETLFTEAVQAAKQAETAVIFAGLPDSFESEGFDRRHMRLPDSQNELIMEIAAVQPNTVVVLHNGSPVEMPWIGKVKGVVEAYLGGQAIGAAVCDVLFGRVNPSGKLPETFPLKLEDNPSYLYYIGEGDRVEYREGIFVGYRYYDKKKMDVLFPFGHGLSYTAFAYSNLRADKDTMKDTESVVVSADITNTGKRAGKETVQLYVEDVESTVIRPVRELRDFIKVELQPGETKQVSFTLSKRAFAYYNTQIHDWYVEPGEFKIQLGASSRDLRQEISIHVDSAQELPRVYTADTAMEDIMGDDRAKEIFTGFMGRETVDKMQSTQQGDGEDSTSAEAISKEMMEATFKYMPLHSITGLDDKPLTRAQLQELIDKLNGKR